MHKKIFFQQDDVDEQDSDSDLPPEMRIPIIDRRRKRPIEYGKINAKQSNTGIQIQ